MDLALLVGNVAIVCTIASNFAGLPVCIQIVKRKSTSGISSLPFLSAAVCTLLWLQYGLMVKDNVVTVVNVIAVVMQCSYLACYCYSASNKATLIRLVILIAIFLIFVHWYCSYVVKREDAVQALGILSSCGSILVSAAPLAGIKEVFKSKSTHNLPFPIIFGTFVVSTLWFVYGFLVGDTFIQVPNLTAGTISGFQLSMFAIFTSKPPPIKKD